jgi:sulfur relay (sulfurtransferase) DsrF/TusC family protein
MPSQKPEVILSRDYASILGLLTSHYDIGKLYACQLSLSERGLSELDHLLSTPIEILNPTRMKKELEKFRRIISF